MGSSDVDALFEYIEKVFDDIAVMIEKLGIYPEFSKDDVALILYNNEYKIKQELKEIIDETR
jgi:hypothetical protein